MSSHHILVADIDQNSANILKDALASKGYQADIAENGAVALELYEKYKYPVIIADLYLPIMSGQELVQRLSGVTPVPVILIQTTNYDPERIIEIMKLGVYDYIIKPVNADYLAGKIHNAFESVENRRLKAVSDKERIVRLENQLDWYKWQERLKNRATKKLDKNLFHSLKTSFSQGAGFGALLTIIISSYHRQKL